MTQSVLAWLSLLGAALCQLGWTYSLKYLQLATLRSLRWSSLTRPVESWPVLAPLLGYIVFGAGVSILLSLAMRSISTTTTFAVWMALSLIFIKISDVLWLKAGYSLTELFFILLIAVGIVGLKVFAPPA